jgi:hypothetical protein
VTTDNPRLSGEGVNALANECVLWTGARTVDGYGVTRWGTSSTTAHRAAWIRANGPVTDGLEIDHLCRNRACINVDHLEPVTSRENDRRSPRTQRDHCPHGHSLTGENLYVQVTARGWVHRSCRICRREASRRYEARSRL